MSNAIQSAIEELVAQISAKEAELAPLKIAVNTLCKQLQQPEAYPNVGGGLGIPGASLTLSWRTDQFHRRPLAGCVVDILETRKQRGLDGPASIDEIYDALKAGGFVFEGTSGSEDNTKRAIKIALTKNTAQFSKVKDDVFGLKKWYGGRGPRKSKPAENGGEPIEEAEQESQSGEVEPEKATVGSTEGGNPTE